MKMNPRANLTERLRLRIKPGRLLCFPPGFLERAGWHVGDAVFMRVENGCLVCNRLPDERAWRIDRLRRRTGSSANLLRSTPMIRTFGDYRALSQAKSKSTHSARKTGASKAITDQT